MENNSISWEPDVLNNFNVLIAKVPVFLQSTAKEKVAKKVEVLVKEDNRNMITEQDLVNAFFIETPFGFHGLLKNDLKAVGIDYVKYGHSA